MRKIIVKIWLLALVAVLLNSTLGYAQNANDSIAVMTFNIRYAGFGDDENAWPNRKHLLVQTILDHPSDFIGLQEVLPVQVDFLKENLPGYGWYSRARTPDPNVGEATSLLYDMSKWEMISGNHFWLSDTPEVPGSNTWGAAFSRMVTYGIFKSKTEGITLLVLNTHFDHVSQPAREKSVALIKEVIRQNTDVDGAVLLGDFNVTDDNPVYRHFLEGELLKDAYTSKVEISGKKAGTYHGWNDMDNRRIDFIFITKNFEVWDARVLNEKYYGRFPSDHFPVRSVLRMD